MNQPISPASPPSESRPTGLSLMRLMRLLFGLRERVSQRAYLTAGVALGTFKYAVDAALVYAATDRFFSPIDYINPLLFMRQKAIAADAATAQPLLIGMVIFALPFLWIGLSMSVRRAIDAGGSPWLGLLFFVPGLNWLMMLGLAVKGSSERSHWPLPEPDVVVDRRLTSGLLGVAAGLLIAGGMTALSVYVLGSYGTSMFLGTPLVMGAAAGFLHNRGHARAPGETVLVAILSVSMTGAAFLLFALEGAICLAMAFPIACGLAVVGAFVGRAIASMGTAPTSHAVAGALLLPFVCGAEAVIEVPTEFSVTTTRDIDAPPAVVWTHVITFSELPPPTEWFFEAGVAYPLRARITGSGVGAIRHCEFSTGAFVEPITVWDEPRRLAFDVTAQPNPMTELSPYAAVNAPHLTNGTITSKHGQFLLQPLDGGRRTRLEGTTWYTLGIGPRDYWRVWSELLLHAIHGRVLDHIAHLSEAPGST